MKKTLFLISLFLIGCDQQTTPTLSRFDWDTYYESYKSVNCPNCGKEATLCLPKNRVNAFKTHYSCECGEYVTWEEETGKISSKQLKL